MLIIGMEILKKVENDVISVTTKEYNIIAEIENYLQEC